MGRPRALSLGPVTSEASPRKAASLHEMPPSQAFQAQSWHPPHARFHPGATTGTTSPMAGPQATGPGSTRKVTNPARCPWHRSADRVSVWQETWRHLGRQHPDALPPRQTPPPQGALTPTESSSSPFFVASVLTLTLGTQAIAIRCKGSDHMRTPVNTLSRGEGEGPAEMGRRWEGSSQAAPPEQRAAVGPSPT